MLVIAFLCASRINQWEHSNQCTYRFVIESSNNKVFTRRVHMFPGGLTILVRLNDIYVEVKHWVGIEAF